MILAGGAVRDARAGPLRPCADLRGRQPALRPGRRLEPPPPSPGRRNSSDDPHGLDPGRRPRRTGRDRTFLVHRFISSRTTNALPLGTLAVNLSGTVLVTPRARSSSPRRGVHTRRHRDARFLHDVLDVDARVPPARRGRLVDAGSPSRSWVTSARAATTFVGSRSGSP